MAECEEKQPTFEQSLAQLESIVSAIEEGKVGLQDAIDQYEKGMTLIQRCRDMLADAEAKVQKLQLTEDNRLARVPMEMPKENDNNSK
jgi:exodeoxyribonuclease VII small subunit